MKSKIKRILYLLLLLIFIPKMIYFCSNFGYDISRTDTFTSNDGKIKVTVKQDFVSRPHVFYKGKRIFAFTGSGFMETVHWTVIFLDEQTIALVSDSHIGEYFEVLLCNG